MAAAPVEAQITAPREAAQIEFGTLALYPTLQILDAGLDDNVFNDPSGAAARLHDDCRVASAVGSSSWLERAAVPGRQRLRVVPRIHVGAVEQHAIRDALQHVGQPVQAVHRRRVRAHAGAPQSRDRRPSAPRRPQRAGRDGVRSVTAHGPDGVRAARRHELRRRRTLSQRCAGRCAEPIGSGSRRRRALRHYAA